ncbi:MAG: glycosyltransferase family 39 protein [Gemmatimonadota bacterium]
MLRLAAYAANRSLFIDEAALALSVRHRSLPGLLVRPLDYSQTAPPGYLLLLGIARRLFGESEYSLRFPALLAGLLSVPLFALLARRVLPASGAITAVALFAFGRPLVHYGGEVKPYAFDALAAVLILALAQRLLARGTTVRAAAAAGTVGVAALLVSQAALFLVASVAPAVLGLLLRERRTGEARRFLLLAAVPWALAAAAASLWYLRVYSPESAEYMRYFWRTGFAPLPPWSARDLLWLPLALLTFGLDPLGTLVPVLPAVLIVAGALHLRRTRPDVVVLALAPVALALLASAARAYPFGRNDFDLVSHSGRVLLFLLPGALLLLGGGAACWWERSRGPGRLAAAGALLLLVGSAAALSLTTFPYTRQEAREALAEVARHRRPGEAIYVDFRSQHYFRYYAPHLGLEGGPIVHGSCHRVDAPEYLAEWDALRPHGRVWYLMLHPSGFDRRIARAYFHLNADQLAAVHRVEAHAFRLRLRPAPRPGAVPDSLFALPPNVTRRDAELSCLGAWKR